MTRLVALTLTAILTVAGAAQAGRTETANGPVHEGTAATVQLPVDLQLRNTVGVDGQGNCVFATLDMCARYQSIDGLIGVMDRMRTREKGGGWPEKVERIIKAYGGVDADVEIVQYQGTDPAILDLAMRTGRPAGVTYGYGEFYGGKTIAHMVLLAHLDENRAAIIDNNDPGHWTWMSRAEFLKRWGHPGGQGWAYVLIAPPPPPVPHN